MPVGPWPAGLGVALALTLSAAACGSSVNKDKLISKMKQDSTFKSMSSKEINCIADTAIKYGDKSKLNDYINGKKPNSDQVDAAVNSKNEKKAENALKKCVS